jgi:tartrate dehydrogenase/decarboxylase/D-malate dehydrogenase
MLEHLGSTNAHDRIVRTIEKVLAGGGPRTPDLGGRATTADVTNAILQELT